MSGWNKDQEVCASCRYWSGKREIDFTASHFYVLEQEATCQKPSGPFHGVIMGEGSYCPKWDAFDNRNN
ncbi:hypothetical protein [Bacillus sp. UNC438CL73TsuS30]|uniref:hypothetical protein n=1 Tax=Bacillus sp. UNC438CL73TsuS30 TaxID=1340434 RepID=UPI00047CC33B|nr:hypothetical protein [Bacillus sp. UNC438CL73TsuS30]